MVGTSDLLNQVVRRTRSVRIARFIAACAPGARYRGRDEPGRPQGVTTFDFLDDLIKLPDGDVSPESAISSDGEM
jgi:hypothetical protein